MPSVITDDTNVNLDEDADLYCAQEVFLQRRESSIAEFYVYINLQINMITIIIMYKYLFFDIIFFLVEGAGGPLSGEKSTNPPFDNCPIFWTRIVPPPPTEGKKIEKKGSYSFTLIL